MARNAVRVREPGDTVAAVLLAMTAAGVFAAFRAFSEIRLEDALITFRYAENLASGQGLVYNVGERVLGTTSPLMALLLGAVGWLGGLPRIDLVSSVLMIPAGAAAGYFLFLGLRRMDLPRPPALFVTAAFLFHPLTLWTTAGGMETPLVLLLMAASLHALAGGGGTAAGALAGLLVVARVDGAIWALSIGAALWLKNPRRALRAAVSGALVLGPWLAFAWSTYGSLLPHSIAAKRAIGGVTALPAAEYSLAFARWVAPFLAASSPVGTIPGLIFLLAGGAVILKRAPGTWVAPLAVFPLTFTVSFCLGRSPLYFDWYMAPVAMISIVIGGIGLWSLAGWLLRRLSSGPARAAAVAGIAIYFGLTAVQGWESARFQRAYQINEEATRRAAGKWLDQHAHPDASVAMEAIGYQGYYSRRRVIDLAGLVSPQVVQIRKNSWSNAEAFHRILKDLRPDYLVLRSFEVDANQHYHGGPLFDSDDHVALFARHYEEATRFEAPLPDLWGPTSYLTIYRRH